MDEPDGIAIARLRSRRPLIDALFYEGAITAATLPALRRRLARRRDGSRSGRGDSNTVTKTLCRFPNAQDTNDSATDWQFCNTRTIGTANQP